MSQTPQKTYWHLLSQKRKPTDYELTSSRLLTHPEKGFEIDVPAKAWFERYQKASPLRAKDWDLFKDPRETTYTSYTELQTKRETFVDQLLDSLETNGYDKHLRPAWISSLARFLPVLRYPCHGLQMISSYVGHLAPSGRIALACLFQTADEIRRVQRLAYRLKQLQLSHSGFGSEAKTLWEKDPMWQPLRETIEKLLVTYDWGEAFVGLNMALKPLFDDMFMNQLGSWARQNGDDRLEAMLSSLSLDCRWHQEWSEALVELLVQEEPANRTVIDGWRTTWAMRSEKSLRPFVFSVSDRMAA